MCTIAEQQVVAYLLSIGVLPNLIEFIWDTDDEVLHEKPVA